MLKPQPTDQDGSPPITRTTIPTCRAHYPGGPDRCMCRLLPCRRGLPRSGAGSASAFTLSRPAQTLLTLRPAGSLNRPRRPLSRGFDPASCPTKPLVSYQINRQLSGWNLPPLVIRAFGAHSRHDCRSTRGRHLLQQLRQPHSPVQMVHPPTRTGTPPLVFAPKIAACWGGATVASSSIRSKTTRSSRGFRMELWFS